MVEKNPSGALLGRTYFCPLTQQYYTLSDLENLRSSVETSAPETAGKKAVWSENPLAETALALTNKGIGIETAIYSASVLEGAVVRCFLDFQEIKSLPKRNRQPDVDNLSEGFSAQSESVDSLQVHHRTLRLNQFGCSTDLMRLRRWYRRWHRTATVQLAYNRAEKVFTPCAEPVLNIRPELFKQSFEFTCNFWFGPELGPNLLQVTITFLLLDCLYRVSLGLGP
ncbi:hypothetical protein CROQUDRAFT_104838 [Cronartium quercuum f. sp. fusiforme G11]|uniref:Uncharacterized protein n=1 Tax=Cronartium quercuum f. sp. fusiforme G11 TaxID=708437 RepID=A0A9P6NUC1_9BASI|nr:hypothetical protein CROQUDRAFT_104838 [Cronartium quercuum f. sp. fusiforme G11]